MLAGWLYHVFSNAIKQRIMEKRYWDRVIEKMPIGLANGYVMTDEEKVFF